MGDRLLGRDRWGLRRAVENDVYGRTSVSKDVDLNRAYESTDPPGDSEYRLIGRKSSYALRPGSVSDLDSYGSSLKEHPIVTSNATSTSILNGYSSSNAVRLHLPRQDVGSRELNGQNREAGYSPSLVRVVSESANAVSNEVGESYSSL